MIGYLPKLYPDETLYSWFCRYNAHNGYLGYVSASVDLLQDCRYHVNIEFFGKLNKDAQKLLEKTYGMEYLVEHHTMFLQYARFATREARQKAMNSLLNNTDDVYTILRFPISQRRKLQYCPACVREDRQKYGEAYWHRNWLLRGMRVCPEHQCLLKEAGITIMSKQSPRWYCAEEVITDLEVVASPDDLTAHLNQYIIDVFQMPLLRENQPNIGKVLSFHLEGTPYMPASGKVRYVRKLLADMQKFYSSLDNNMVTKYHQLQKILLGEISNLFEVCQAACFLKIPAEELCNPVLPEKNQKERFHETVAELSDRGFGRYRIARQIGCSPCTVGNERKGRQAKARVYSVRKGHARQDWRKLDSEAVPKVRQLCEQVYHGTGNPDGRPGKVSKLKVNRLMGWPRDRIKYYQQCSEIVDSYQETWGHYWAREIIWAWDVLSSEKSQNEISWTNIYDLTSIRTYHIEKCLPYISEPGIREFLVQTIQMLKL